MGMSTLKARISIALLLGGLVLSIALSGGHWVLVTSGVPAEDADVSVFVALIALTGGALLYAFFGARE